MDLLRRLLDAAPVDDEPVTEEDLAAICQGLEEKTRGEAVDHEEIKGWIRTSFSEDD